MHDFALTSTFFSIAMIARSFFSLSAKASWLAEGADGAGVVAPAATWQCERITNELKRECNFF